MDRQGAGRMEKQNGRSPRFFARVRDKFLPSLEFIGGLPRLGEAGSPSPPPINRVDQAGLSWISLDGAGRLCATCACGPASSRFARPDLWTTLGGVNAQATPGLARHRTGRGRAVLLPFNCVVSVKSDFNLFTME